MQHSIAYGDKTLEFEVPDPCSVEIVGPSKSHGSRSLRESNGGNDTGRSTIYRSILGSLKNYERAILKSSKILVACDDNTRVTPVKVLLDPILAYLKELGKVVEIIIAGGSHRRMDKAEKVEKFGMSIHENYTIHDHDWDEERTFTNFGRSSRGYDLKVNKLVCDPDVFLIGLGNIVPHRVAGYSGGYKILLPGLSSPDTINKIHFMSAKYCSEAILGFARNPVREMINEIHEFRPINILANTVLDGNSNIASLCVGDPITSQYQGASIAKKIYGVDVNEPADIVIADSVPEVLDFWVCAKAVVNTKSFVKKGGHLIVLAPCTEGLSPSHGNILLKYGYHFPAKIQEMVEAGDIDPSHLIEASHLAHVGEVIEHCNLHVVTDGLAGNIMSKQKILVERPQDLDQLIHDIVKDLKAKGNSNPITFKIVRRGSEILPSV